MDFYYVKIAFYATLFTWFVTALGASMVFLFKKVSNKIMSLMFGFGAGVMIAASFFSLILPGIELADEMNQISYLVIGLGVLFGGLLIFLIDVFIPHMHINKETPEGMAVSVPLRSEGISRKKAFFYGQASGMVEPISAVIGAILVTFIKPILPFVLGFAAGAMIYVVAEELIPSGKTSKKDKFGTIGVMIGFILMMVLDIALG